MEVFDFNVALEKKVIKNKKTVLSIGVFDGLHNGHKKVLTTLNKAKNNILGSKSVVITFNKNPKDKSILSLDTLNLRLDYLKDFDVDYAIVIDFSDEFSKITSSEFIGMLLALTDLKKVVVGKDFNFGSLESAATSYDLHSLFLKNKKDVDVEIVEQILSEGGEKISSTLLRRLVKEGKLNDYLKLSGQDYQIDLRGLTNLNNFDYLTFTRSSISQILPPLGFYKGILVKDRKEIKADSEITEEAIKFDCASSSKFDKYIFIKRKEND